MRLRTRIALLSASAVAVTMLVMLLVALWAARTQSRAELDEQLKERAAEVDSTGEIIRIVRSPARFNLEDSLIQVIDDQGRVLFNSLETLPVDKKDQAVALNLRKDSWSNVKVKDVRLRVYTARVRWANNVAVMVARPLTEIDETLVRLRNSLGVVALLGVGAAGLLGFVVAGRSMRPIRKLSNAAVEVARTQDLTRRIEPEGPGELSDLADSFNAMLAALSLSRDQQKQLVDDASHELRTPLTSLRTNIEILLREQRSPEAPRMSDEDRQQLLNDVRLELTDLTELVAEMVALASYEYETGNAETIDLAEVVRGVVERYRHRSNRDIRLTTEPCEVVAVPSLVQRAVSNLIDNALKWGPPEQPVEVEVADGAVTVIDRGPGIDPQHRDKVFERFYRAPEARSMPGSGLGLAIVAQVAESTGGSAEVLDTGRPGAAVRLRFGATGLSETAS